MASTAQSQELLPTCQLQLGPCPLSLSQPNPASGVGEGPILVPLSPQPWLGGHTPLPVAPNSPLPSEISMAPPPPTPTHL